MGIYPRHSGARARPESGCARRIGFWSPDPGFDRPRMTRSSSLLSLLRLLPFRQESESLGLVQIVQERLIDRHWPRLVSDQLTHALHCRFALHVGTQRIE